MKRKVERERNLPAFSIGMGELEVLWDRLLALFDDKKHIYSSIDIELSSEKLDFENVEDLKHYAQLHGRISKFSIYLSQGDRRIWIRASSYIGSSPATVNAEAETEVWCAGAIETVYSFLQSHRVWYHWFVSAPLGWIIGIIIVFGNALFIARTFFPSEIVYPRSIFTAWLTIIVALAILFGARGKLLPWSTLRISEDEGFIRRHVGELSLIVGLIGLVLMLIQFVFGK